MIRISKLRTVLQPKMSKRLSVRYLSALASEREHAFDMSASNIRFGKGSSKEVGFDLKNWGITSKVCVFTDKTIANLPPFKTVSDSLRRAGVDFEVFDEVQVEPTDKSMKKAIEFCQKKQFDAFVAVGGGSTIDTAKAANLYMCYPKHDFLDFVNAPIGKGMPCPGKLKPLIAIPTTAGTGSETTGVAIFDLEETGTKTGIRDKALKPILGIVDPDHTLHCSPELTAFAGLDVLCHALESYTAIPYSSRARPQNPGLRPAYQGNNPIADIWCGYALQQCSKYLLRAVADPGDVEAREAMCYASTAAGIGFGNAGVHLCHGMSYPIASNVKSYMPPSGYSGPAIKKRAIVPHGLSVVLTAPAVFRWTSDSDPDRHLRAAELLGANIHNAKRDAAGDILSERILFLLDHWRHFLPDGLQEVGYSSKDTEMLVKGALAQKRLLEISPKVPSPQDLGNIFEKSMKLF